MEIRMTDRIYYTYAYLRSDGTPYYIGRGKGNRAFDITHRVKVPPKERILFLKKNLTYSGATAHEVYMIAVLGRKDLGSGILRNLTNGGEGRPGPKSREECMKISKSLSGRRLTTEHAEKLRKARLGKPHSPETKKMMSEQKIGNTHASGGKGSKWWNNGVRQTKSKKSPGEGWFLGKLYGAGFKGKTHSEEKCHEFSEDRKNRRHWVNKENETKFQKVCPGEGWIPGRKWREV
jgi:hypothetical protein